MTRASVPIESRWRLGRWLWTRFYSYTTKAFTSESSAAPPVLFLNYGFVDPEAEVLPLDPKDESDRICIQLYHHVTRSVELAGLDVLEVSSGHGGGSSYLMRYAHPRSVTGIDINADAVNFCRAHYDVPGLSFHWGDAQKLDFPDCQFDAVVNVEASHRYPDVGAFVAEVERVLRPGGYFLYTDFRNREQVDAWRALLEESGLEILSCRDITPHILQATDAQSDRWRRLIRERVPRSRRWLFERVTAVQGSPFYKKLHSGAVVYWSFVLQKRVAVG